MTVTFANPSTTKFVVDGKEYRAEDLTLELYKRLVQRSPSFESILKLSNQEDNGKTSTAKKSKES